MSSLIGSQWQLKLNVGIEPGSYLARTGWGASEGRLIVNTAVRFEDTKVTEAEDLVGPLSGTRVLSVDDNAAPSTFVSMEGEQQVRFTSGGWCVQRVIGASKDSEGLLRFWLDCPSGAQKGDVTIDAGERIFFSTGIYDDATGLSELVEQRTAMEAKLADAKAEAKKPPMEESNPLAKLLAFRSSITEQDERTSLRYQQQFFDAIPSLGAAPAAITVGPAQCGLSVKRQSEAGMFGSKAVYHILGRFEMEAASDV